ncbi:uncharacterized protein C22orf15 homolog isoform X2 [Oryctolagus cuniculus]|uniref:uncharacterized protein C22orf15 homolog isoform X2 n=1 Tax=Oryctolagus cuniculus TaxID=9986 RepID=UPI003879BB53
MFITVMFGAGCRELVNPWCNLVTLSAHLRRRGGVPPDAPIALLAEDGNLVSLDEGLEEGASPAACMGGSLLQERGTYVLVHIISKWNTRVSLGAMKGGDCISCPYPGLSPKLPPPNALVLTPAWPGMGDEMGITRVSQGPFTLSHPPQRGRAWPPPAMSPSWRTWMRIPQSWQVSVKAEPWWGGHMSPQPLPPGGLPGPSRRAALAVRPPSHGQQLQEAHEHSAWPPGARPPFEASEGGLPAIQDPLAGARSQARADPMTWDTAAKWPSWTHTQRGFAMISALCDLAQTDGSRAGFHLQNLE